MVARQVEIDEKCATGSSLICFVHTGNQTDVPIACLAGNNGFPEVQALYVWGIEHNPGAPGTAPLKGVQIVVRLTGPATGTAITVSLLQEKMPGPMAIYPLI